MNQLEKNSKQSRGFTAEEKAAMKQRAKEQQAEERASKDRAEGERDVLAKIAEMSEPDRTMAARIHEIITTNAPDLSPRTWYGQPAYARDGKIICFFQPRQKFNTRYATLGFNDAANRLRPDGVNPRRRGADQRPYKESGKLLTRQGRCGGLHG